jgi:hypothetical protein
MQSGPLLRQKTACLDKPSAREMVERLGALALDGADRMSVEVLL